MSFICLALPKEAEAANWVWVTSTDYATISIDAASARRYNGQITFWDQCEYIDSAERNKRIDRLTQICRDNGDYQTDFSDMYFTRSQNYAYKAANGTIYNKLVSLIFYDSEWNVITTTNYPTEWQPVPPDTILEAECLKAFYFAH